MYYSRIFIILIFALCTAPVLAQKRNGKVSIPVEKGGVEKGRIKNGQREGVWRTYNSKGDIIQTENYLHGKRDGEFRRTEDSLVITGTYTANQKNGTFTTKVNGKVISEINYLLDTLHGNYFIDTKEKKISGVYDHGKKTGLRVVDSLNYYTAQIRDSTYFVNGLRDGRSVIYQEGFLLSETYWKQGKRNGPSRLYDDAQRLLETGNYTNDQRDGIWRICTGGRLSEIHDYENGIHAANTIGYGADTTIISSVTAYYPNGDIRSVLTNDEKGRPAMRRYYGPKVNLDSTLTYYPSGRVRSAQYTSYTNAEGQTQFYLYKAYHENGQLQAHGYKHRAEKTGTWLMYDSLGRLETNISYQENKPFGWFKAYYPNGRMKLQAYCYEGITDTILVFSSAGAKLKQSDPNYSKIIDQVQAQHADINFRDPNKFPPDHRRKGIVSLGPDANEGKWADEPATFPGGNDSLNAFIKKMVRYPEPERRLSKEGEVHIKFLIEKDGTLSDIQIVKTAAGAPGFTKETMRLMRAMPKWKPAKTNGKIVRVYYILPVKFSLQ